MMKKITANRVFQKSNYYSRYFVCALFVHIIILAFFIIDLTLSLRNNFADTSASQSIIQATVISSQVMEQYNTEKAAMQTQQLQAQKEKQAQIERQASEKKALMQIQKIAVEKSLLQAQQLAAEKLQQAQQKIEQQKQTQQAAQKIAEKTALAQQMKKMIQQDLKHNVLLHSKTSHTDLNQLIKNNIQQELKQNTQALNSNKNLSDHNSLSHQTTTLQSQNSSQSIGEIDKYKSLVIRAISQQWIVPSGLTENIFCELSIRIAPGGVVLSVSVLKSSGNSILDNSAIAAVNKASPLPVPANPALFDQFREMHLTVKPDGSMTES